jgi:protein ImuB
VARWACAELPSLPMQLLLRAHSDWRSHPAVVVAQDLPQSPVLWVNDVARQAGIVPGLRYASALTLAPGLRAGMVPEPEVARAVAAITEALRRFSPHVEPARDEPGVFWMDASGLERLHASLSDWARSIREGLSHIGFDAVVVVGFTRFGTYAVARMTRGTRVLADPDEEGNVARSVLLRRLHLPPDTLDALERLGVRTVQNLLRLPSGGVLERFGPIVQHLHRLASGDLWTPLLPQPAVEPVRRHLVLDTPEADAQRLLFVVKQILHPLLARLASRGQALAVLDLRLRLGSSGWSSEAIRPAAPTLDAVRLADLVRLRFETMRIEAGVTEVIVETAGVPAAPEQLAALSVPAAGPARDLESGTRALDRLRARYGDGVAACAVLREGHLPEARFGWEPAITLRVARPRAATTRPLMRRIFERPVLLGDHLTPPDEQGPRPASGAGPYVVSGGWWVRDTHRAYYFMEGPHREVWWVFYDGIRRRWYLHGRVE